VSLAEAGTTNRLAKILALHSYNAAHFCQPGSHSFTDAISERLTTRGTLRAAHLRSGNGVRFRTWFVWKVGRDDRRLVIVVLCIQDEADGILYLLGRFHSTQFI
jgi:hypothetical protein